MIKIDNKYINAIRRVVNSKFIGVLPATLSLLGHFTGLDCLFYYIYAATLIVCLIFSDDSKPMLPYAFCAYCLVSLQNGPSNTANQGDRYDFSYYQSPKMITLYFVMGGLLVATMIVKLIYHLKTATHRPPFPRYLIVGIALFGSALILNSLDIYEFIGATQWAEATQYLFSNTLVGLMEVFFLFLLFFYFYYTLEWKKNAAEYMFNSILLASLVVCVQVIARIIQQSIAGVIIHPEFGTIDRDVLDLGWGVCNNIAPYITLGIPAALYLANYRKRGYIYYIIAFLLFAIQLPLQSRTAILAGVLTLILGSILLFIYGWNRYRQKTKYCMVVCLSVICITSITLLFTDLMDLIPRITDTSDNGRFVLWQRGLDAFANSPFFGSGFNKDIGLDGTIIFCNMYHNEIIQVIATCGLYGLAGFAIHKYQLWTMIFRRPTLIRLHCGLMFFLIAVLSLFDNNFFLPFIGLVYSAVMALAAQDFTEKCRLNPLPEDRRI
ncbi:MAG: O-antigen ligase family protein [Clostridia bacterium]|nr:O-antigen ligase family protein [Clostridia bacterium]